MTYNEIISQLDNEFSLVHADSRLTNKFWYSLIQKHTSWIIKQESDKMFLFHSDSIWQTLDCVDLIEVPTTDECCKYNGPSCTIYRTKEKIPSLYEDVFGVIIKSINSIDYSKSLQHITFQEWLRKQKNPDSKYDKNFYYFYKNGFLYFPNIKWKLVSITGYFKDSIKKYNTCNGKKDDVCESLFESEWRIPSHLIARVVEVCLKELSSTYMQTKEDSQIDKNIINVR
jgi:hypothetical protein